MEHGGVLIRSGLVVERKRPGGRKYVRPNRGLPTYRTLLGVLLALKKSGLYLPSTMLTGGRCRTTQS